MRAVFAQGAPDPVGLEIPEGLTLAESGAGDAVREGMTVAVFADGSLRFQGEVVPAMPLLHTRLGLAIKKTQAADSEVAPPEQLAVIADAGAPASVIAAIGEGLPAGLSLVLIVHVAGEGLPTPPPMSEAVAAALAAPNRQGASLDLMIPSLSACKRLEDAWNDTIMDNPFERRAEVLFRVIPDALENCRCGEKIDVATLTALIWADWGRSERRRRQLPLALVRDPAAELVPLAANATVRELVTIVEGRAGRPFRLAPAV